jgi:membrane peptidoglycan carboxypeptidase
VTEGEQNALDLQDDVDLAALIALRRARRRRAPRRRVALVIVLVAAGILAATLAGAAFTGRALVFSSCDLNALRPITLGENSFLYASDGSLLGVIPSTRNRQSLQLQKMSPWLPKATVAIEDNRFW